MSDGSSPKLKVLDIFQLYDDVLNSWAGYNEEEENDVDSSFAKQVRAKSDKIGRNDPCPCGSGKKYKKCCMKNG